jgi:hypothetical protein
MKRAGQTPQAVADALRKRVDDPEAIDFAIVADPFLTRLIEEMPAEFEIGASGLYELHYSVVAHRGDVDRDPAGFSRLLKELLDAERSLATKRTAEELYAVKWVGQSGAAFGRLPRMLSFRREALGIQLQPARLRMLLDDEIDYLVLAYPTRFKKVTDLDRAVTSHLLRQIAPDRVKGG